MDSSSAPVLPFQKLQRGLRVLDFLGAGASVLWGAHLLHSQGLGAGWPLAWILGGLAGALFAYFNGAQRLLQRLLSRIKRPISAPPRAVRGYPAPPSTPFQPRKRP